MPKIAIDYTPAYEQGGGIGRYVRELIAALAREDHQTAYNLFIAGAAKHTLPSALGANFVWKPTRLSPRALARIWHRLKIPLPVETFTGNIDLYHATDFVLPPTHPKTRTILQVHDLSFVRVPETASPRLKAYLDRVVPASAQRADHIIADSQATKDDLQSLYGIPANKMTVLHGGVDARFTPANREAIQAVREKYQLDQWTFILSVGTVQPRKNYERLIQALARLRQNGYDIHLVIAGGKGWLDDPIYRMIDTTGMHSYVHFIGFVDDNDMPAHYSAADCFAFPSLYEGFGLPVLEAMACHTPVLTSTVSSLPEAAGNAAVLVDPYDLDAIIDGLEQIISDTTLRNLLIEQGAQQASQFTWRVSARKLYEIYFEIV